MRRAKCSNKAFAILNVVQESIVLSTSNQLPNSVRPGSSQLVGFVKNPDIFCVSLKMFSCARTEKPQEKPS